MKGEKVMLKRLRRLVLFAVILAIALVPSFSFMMVANAAGIATVNLSAEKQLIRGFGGMNYPDWQGSDLTPAQRQTAFGNGEKDLGFTILRIHVDPEKSNWSKELETAKAAIKNGAIVFASPWHPPAALAQTVNGQKHVNPSKYAEYAKHLNDFVAYMKENGVDLYAISIQNEPDYADDWTWWTPQEMLNFMKNYAGTINCRVMAPESFQYRTNMSDPILNDATALANLDILGAHLYGVDNPGAYPLFKQKGAGKELWMTEVYYPNSSSDANFWPEALRTGEHIHKSLVDAEFQTYVWWFIRRYYGPMKEDGTMSKRGAMMAHYSKYVRPGYVRVDATKNPDTNVLVSAYKGDGKVVVVAINKGTSVVSQQFSIQGGKPAKMSSWVTTGSSNLAPGASINVSNGSFTASLPAQSITTFVGDLDEKPSPTATHTKAPTPTNTKAPTPTNTPSPVVKTPDVNGDGAINIADVILVATGFNTAKGDARYVEAYDLNSDNSINIGDVMLIAVKFNTMV